MPDVASTLRGIGGEPVGNTPQQLAKIIAEDTARWAKDAGIPQQ
jgi:hypothetical protein